MPGEDNDLSSRFDYLFEPLKEQESADDTIDAVSPASDPRDDETPSRSAAPLRLGFAAFVLATLGAVAVVATLLLQRPNEPVDAPLDAAPRSTTEPNTTPPAGPVPPVATAAEVPAEAPQTVDQGPSQQTAPQSQAPTAPRREPEVHVTNSPTTRAPISVAPETRQPFPNQRRRRWPTRGG